MDTTKCDECPEWWDEMLVHEHGRIIPTNFLPLQPMKRLFTIFLAFVMFTQSVSALIVAAGFYVNRDFIAQNLCENRNFEELACKGQCVLMKKLKEQQEQEQNIPEVKLKEITLFQGAHELVTLSGSDLEQFCLNPLHVESCDPYVFLPTFAIFHPPASC